MTSTQLIPAPSSNSNRWLQNISCGGLWEPSVYWFNAVISMENDLRQFHGHRLQRHSGITKQLTSITITKYSYMPAATIHCFVCTQTFIRLHLLNCQLTDKKQFIKRKMRSYFLDFTLILILNTYLGAHILNVCSVLAICNCAH